MIWLAAAAGGAVGSLARHGVNLLFARLLDRSVPYATAAVNLSGSLAIGTLAGLLASGRLEMAPVVRVFVFVGVLGGFTTFSSLMLDVLSLTQGGERTLAFANIALQTLAGLAAVWWGYSLGLRD